MVGLYQISLSIYRSYPVCEGTNDRPVAALRAAPRRMFIFDASSLAPLGSRRPSAGAKRPRMFGSQENTLYLDLYEDTGRTRSTVTRAEAIDVTGPRQGGTDVRSKNGHFRNFRVHRIWVTFVYMRIGLANSGHFRVHSRSDIAGDYDLIRARGGRASCT